MLLLLAIALFAVAVPKIIEAVRNRDKGGEGENPGASLIREVVQSNANNAMALDRLATAINTQTDFFRQKGLTDSQKVDELLTEVKLNRQTTREETEKVGKQLQEHHQKQIELCSGCKRG